MKRSPVALLRDISPSKRRATVLALVSDDDESFRKGSTLYGFVCCGVLLEVGDFVSIAELEPGGPYVISGAVLSKRARAERCHRRRALIQAG